MEKFRHSTTLCALAGLKLKFDPQCYKGQISLMRKAMNDSFSYAEIKKLWLQARLALLAPLYTAVSVKVGTFEGADSHGM